MDLTINYSAHVRIHEQVYFDNEDLERIISNTLKEYRSHALNTGFEDMTNDVCSEIMNEAARRNQEEYDIDEYDIDFCDLNDNEVKDAIIKYLIKYYLEN